MKAILASSQNRRVKRSAALASGLLALMFWPIDARASIFKGETLDTVADVLTWVVLVVAPIIALAVFLLIHILPEKIAERREHPQAKAIQCLCLLSLVFGGLLWPLAWLWAYTRPVMHKLAYGTDRIAHGDEDAGESVRANREEEELKQLRRRVTELESRQAGRGAKGE